jgi:hypothetical protein
MPREDEETESTQETWADEPQDQEIDLQVLAQKVYGLLKEEARLERERLGLRSAE